jgi:phage shock protein C
VFDDGEGFVASTHPLRRSRRHRIVGGVCGGLADWLGWNPTLVRILYVAVSILSAAFPGTLVYVVLWLVIPQEP